MNSTVFTPPHAPGVAGCPTLEPPRRSSSLKLDFHNARLETVLNYLRESAGLLIHAKSYVPLDPTVDLCHEEPVSPTDAVLLLKKVLVDKGWMLVQRGPFFNIINNRDLKKSCIPLPSI